MNKRGAIQIIPLIILSLVAVATFVVSRNTEKQQELRGRAQSCLSEGTFCIPNPQGCCSGLYCDTVCRKNYVAPTPTPVSNRYTCNSSFQCEKDPNGKYGSSFECENECEAPPPPQPTPTPSLICENCQWGISTCSVMNLYNGNGGYCPSGAICCGGSLPDPTPTPTSSTNYSCNSFFQCVPDPQGRYPDYLKCDNACIPPLPTPTPPNNVQEPCRVCMDQQCVTVDNIPYCEPRLNQCSTNSNCVTVNPSPPPQSRDTTPTKVQECVDSCRGDQTCEENCKNPPLSCIGPGENIDINNSSFHCCAPYIPYSNTVINNTPGYSCQSSTAVCKKDNELVSCNDADGVCCGDMVKGYLGSSCICRNLPLLAKLGELCGTTADRSECEQPNVCFRNVCTDPKTLSSDPSCQNGTNTSTSCISSVPWAMYDPLTPEYKAYAYYGQANPCETNPGSLACSQYRQSAYEYQLTQAQTNYQKENVQNCYDHPESQQCIDYQKNAAYAAFGISMVPIAGIFAPAVSLPTILPAAAFQSPTALFVYGSAYYGEAIATTLSAIELTTTAYVTYKCVENPYSTECQSFIAGAGWNPGMVTEGLTGSWNQLKQWSLNLTAYDRNILYNSPSYREGQKVIDSRSDYLFTKNVKNQYLSPQQIILNSYSGEAAASFNSNRAPANSSYYNGTITLPNKNTPSLPVYEYHEQAHAFRDLNGQFEKLNYFVKNIPNKSVQQVMRRSLEEAGTISSTLDFLRTYGYPSQFINSQRRYLEEMSSNYLWALKNANSPLTGKIQTLNKPLSNLKILTSNTPLFNPDGTILIPNTYPAGQILDINYQINPGGFLISPYQGRWVQYRGFISDNPTILPVSP